MTSASTSVLPAAAALSRLREARPLVQCITNQVVTGFTANVLLAIGATPAMVDLPDEAGLFARVADGLLVNLGTPTTQQQEAAREAVAQTRQWVLDPVAIGALPVRTALAHELWQARPAIVRGNASEILALAGLGEGGRGVDSLDRPEAAEEAAIELARAGGAVVAVSGETDLITDGREVVRIRGGSDLLTLVTGGGCSLGATMAAFLGVTDPLSAAVAASLIHKNAASSAASSARGPGSFAVAFVDALSTIGDDDLPESQVERAEAPR